MSIYSGFFSVDGDLNRMIKTIIRDHHWEPVVIDRLFLDNVDHQGLEYWYEDTLDFISKLK